MLDIGDRWEGAISDGRTVSLTVTSTQCLTQIAGWGGFEAHASALLGGLGLTCPAAYDRPERAGSLRAWRIAPDRLLLQSAEKPHLNPTPDVVMLDLSHARKAVTITGPAAAGLLARAAAIDFSDKAFPPGSFAQTSIHGIGVLIDRPEREVFEVLIPGSWAQSLVEVLTAHLTPSAEVH